MSFAFVVQLLSHVPLFTISWTAAHQAPPSSTISWSLLRFMSIESVILSNHFTLCGPLSFLSSIFSSIRVLFSMTQGLFFALGGQSTGASASASILPMNIQGWFPLGLTDLISFCPRDSQESSPRWQRSRWTWNTSLSTDTSGIHLQTQKYMQNTS